MSTPCRSCGETVSVFLDFGPTPLADEFPRTPQEGADQALWRLQVGICEVCWLVQLMGDVPDETLYGSEYGFFSGSSPALVRHFKAYADWVKRVYPDELDLGVFEIACNDGTLLGRFPRHRAMGMDPAGPPTEAARAAGLNVITAPFDLAHATAMTETSAKPGVIIANNVLAHVRRPNDLLAGVKELLHPDGVAVLEFQYLADLIVGNQFDLFYHEHRSYLSLSSVAKMLAANDLIMVDHFPVSMQGGSMRVVARHDRSLVRAGGLPHESWLCSLGAYEGMQSRVSHSINRLCDVVSDFDVVAGWAASAKATTLLHASGLHRALAWVVDTTPSKIGRFMPGTNVEIVETQPDSPDAMLLLSSNYLGGAVRRERDYLDQGGRFIVPLPLATVI